ncbi:nuclear transport factor 2 family protein [Myxococcota bacterium]|nr:nuclear transport factor 2 family protein [Myxococcota bacterium]
MALPDRETTQRWFQAHPVHRADQALTPRDWANMAELFAEDAEYLDSTYGMHRGRPAIRRFLHDSIVGLEDWRFPIQWMEIGQGRVAVHLLNRAPGQRRDGSHYEFPSVTLVEYGEDGLIRRQLDIYDRLSAVRTFFAAVLGGWWPGTRMLLGRKPPLPDDLR